MPRPMVAPGSGLHAVGLSLGGRQRHAKLVHEHALGQARGDIEADGPGVGEFEPPLVVFAGAEHLDAGDRGESGALRACGPALLASLGRRLAALVRRRPARTAPLIPGPPVIVGGTVMPNDFLSLPAGSNQTVKPAAPSIVRVACSLDASATYRDSPSLRTPSDTGVEPRVTSGDDHSVSLPSMVGASALHALSMRRASAATAMATAATTAASAISSQALRRRRGLFPGTSSS